jgi:hypothetical protein
MNDRELVKALIEKSRSADKGCFHIAHLIACFLDKRLHEQLQQLVNGPVWDGDVIAKSYRDELIELGLAVRVCCKGEDGFTGARYIAKTVCKKIEEIRTGKIAA